VEDGAGWGGRSGTVMAPPVPPARLRTVPSGERSTQEQDSQAGDASWTDQATWHGCAPHSLKMRTRCCGARVGGERQPLPKRSRPEVKAGGRSLPCSTHRVPHRNLPAWWMAATGTAPHQLSRRRRNCGLESRGYALPFGMALSADTGRTLISTFLSSLPAPASPMVLSHVEVLAAQALFSGDVALAREEVESLARRLAGVDGASCRRQLVSVELTLAHYQVLALQAILGAVTKKRDEAGATAISILLTHATRRVAVLAAAHAGRPRPVLVVGHADRISIGSGEAL
jgi:hypothetical protein